MNPLQQQMLQQQQQPGMMSMDAMQSQQQQYGGASNMGYADSQQVQRLLRPGPPMGQQMHQQNVMMQGVPQQQQHPMQMQQGGQQQMVPGQTMIGARPMVMQQQQGGRMVMPNNYENFMASLPNDIRQKILQEPPEKRPALLRKIMDMQQQNQRQRMTAAARPQQWSTGAGSDTMAGQQPGHQYGGGGPAPQMISSYANQMVPTNQAQPGGYPAQRHPGMIPGQPQLQPNMNVLPQQRIYDSPNQPANQPGSYMPVNRQPGSQVPGQQLQTHQQQPVNPYSHPAGPSPGGFSNLAYPSPSPVHPLSSGTSPGYAAADASPGYPNVPIMSQKLPEPSPLPVNSVEQTSSAIGGSADDTLYKEKIRELQIYMDHLKQSLREGNVSGAQNKVQRFIDILEGRSKVPYDVLLKCEETFKKQAANRRPAEPDPKASVCQPFLDAVVAVVANKPNANAILKRTFDFPWKNIPAGKKICPPQMPSKKIKTEIKTEVDDLDDSCESAAKSESEKCDEKINEKLSSSVPLTIQREVASLEPKFRIILDKTKSALSVEEKMIHVLCDIEDNSLPLVPSLKIRIPLDYPMMNPKCNFEFDDYSGTPIFDDIKRHLNGKFSKLSGTYSITTLLTNWELCVRQACAV